MEEKTKKSIKIDNETHKLVKEFADRKGIVMERLIKGCLGTKQLEDYMKGLMDK